MRSRSERIGEAFAQQAAAYEEQAWLQPRVAERLLADLPDQGPRRILEIGCGTGFLSRLLAQRYPEAELTLTDISGGMLERCQEQMPASDRIRYQQLDVAHWKPKRAYDLIVSTMVMQWLDEPIQALIALQQSLHPGGQLFYSRLAPDAFPEWRQGLKQLGLPSGLLDRDGAPGLYRTEDILHSYPSSLAFLQELKHLGTHSPRPGYPGLSAGELRRACRETDRISGGNITWRIQYGRLSAYVCDL